MRRAHHFPITHRVWAQRRSLHLILVSNYPWQGILIAARRSSSAVALVAGVAVRDRCHCRRVCNTRDNRHARDA